MVLKAPGFDVRMTVAAEGPREISLSLLGMWSRGRLLGSNLFDILFGHLFGILGRSLLAFLGGSLSDFAS